MALDHFFTEQPAFRYEELLAYLSREKPYKETTLKALLHYHVQKSHITRIRRGYYAVTATKFNQNTDDIFLIAGRVSDASIIAYHTALAFYGIAYSLLNTVYFINDKPMAAFEFQGVGYNAVLAPKALLPDAALNETKRHDRFGLTIRVTSIERTFVDCLDKPQFSGGYEEIWQAANMIDFLDVERMIAYAFQLSNATTIAKLGLFLEMHQEQFQVDEQLLVQLEKNKPKGIHYLSRGSSDNCYQRRWNLMSPKSIQDQDWKENNDF